MNECAPGANDTEFRAFIDHCLEAIGRAGNDREAAERIAALAADLTPRWRIQDPRYERPQRDLPYGSYLLYLHPDERLCVVQDVFLPGQTTGVHNHGIWGVVGVVRGRERERRFAVSDRFDIPPREVGTKEYGTGAVSIVLPDETDWHAIESAGPGPSVSLHIYGGDIGRRARLMWDDEHRRFVEFQSGYSNNGEGLPTYLPAGV